MSFDGLVFNKVITLLNKTIINTKINKIYQISSTDFIFVLFNKNIKTNMVVSTNNYASYISLNENIDKQKNDKSHFVESLFHHLVNGIIRDIKQINNDRIVELSVDKMDDLGDIKTNHLFIELTGKATNMILTKNDLVIIDAMHKTGISSVRTIASGGKYNVPFMTKLKDPFSDIYDSSVELSKQFNGFSKIISDEFNYRLNKNESFNDIMNELKNSNTLYMYDNDYHLIELKHLNKEYKSYPIFEGLNEYYSKNVIETVSDESKKLTNIVIKEIKHYTNKIEKLKKEIENAENASLYLKYGDDIFAYIHDLNNKTNRIHIDSYDESYDLNIDDKLTIKENALKFYKKYQKLKNSKEIINEQINIAKDNLEYFSNIKHQIPNCNDEELNDIKEELINERVIKVNEKKQMKKQKRVTYATYEIDGIKVSVGKNNFQNEYLTFKVAKYNEYFFHVKDYSGSHVIVHTNELNEKVIRFAANLAAINSIASESSSVPVNYTLVKNVKKIPGGKIGKVLLKEYKTIYIDPNKNY